MMIPKLPLNYFCLLLISKKKNCDVLVSSISFFKSLYEERKFDMLCLMLDPKFKSLCLILFFIGREEEVNIVKNMIDESYAFEMLSLFTPNGKI